MKLISVKILGDNFRSLTANKLYEFNISKNTNRLSTKIFAGLNGSGKSNFLELFSEIFYFLETYHLSTVSETEKENKNFGFEIEYLLPKNEIDIYELFAYEFESIKERYISNNYSLTKLRRGNFENLYNAEIENSILSELKILCKQVLEDGQVHVKISKELGLKPEFSLKRFSEKDSFKKLDFFTQNVLPSRVIAYTSGQNELLSNPYYKLKYHYFKTFEQKKQKDLAENHRLFFLDYSTNFSIFISNMLLADKTKLSYLKKILNVNYLKSFRITINTDEIYKRVIPVNDSLNKKIQKLKQCATTWTEKSVGKHKLLILDFLVNNATIDAFEYHFVSAFNLFKFFYELEIFNLYLVNKQTRDLMLRVHKTYNFADEMPKPDPSRLVFRIEKIWINKTVDESAKKTRNIYYKALSDGEHQFNEVIGTVLMMEQEGCLFLMDEPDTHFNPRWRAKLIQLLNFVAAKKLTKAGKVSEVRNQELIITTHSPFVISDSYKEDVYKINKGSYTNPKPQTYGASIGLINEIIFDRDISISDLANSELEQIRKNVKIPEEVDEAEKSLVNFGESIEKFDVYSYLLEKKKENIKVKGSNKKK